MYSLKYSQSDCKTICVWFSLRCDDKDSEAVHQANLSMEKDCLVNEVWSAATEGCVCHQIYSAVALWFPAAVKQWGGDWSKLHCSCQPPSCLQPFDGVALSLTNKLSLFRALARTRTHKNTAISLLTTHTLFISVWYSVCHLFFLFFSNVKTQHGYMTNKLHSD